MRTVSFSNNDVRSLLKKNFVNTYTNITGDPTAGKSVWHSPDELAGSCARGLGSQNVQTIFMTPKGEIFHAANGHLSGDELVEEIEFAQTLFTEIKGSPRSAKEKVRRAHRDRLEELGFDAEEIEKAMSPSPGDLVSSVADVEPGNIFAGKSKRQVLKGNCFSINHPMMHYRALEKDPTPLVGKESSSFVSRRANGSQPSKPRISTEESPDSKKEEDKGVKLPAGFPELPEGFPKF